MAFLTPPIFPASYFAAPPPQSTPTPFPIRKRRHLPVALSFPSIPLPAPRTVLLSDVDVIERQKFPLSVLHQNFSHLLHKRVTRDEVDAAITKCNEWFVKNGFVCSRLLIVQYPGWFTRTLVLYSVEPKLSTLRLIVVDKDGEEQLDVQPVTRTNTVLRVLGMQLGDIFEWHPEGFGALMGLGIFEYADAEVNVITKEIVELNLKIRERPSRRVEPGAGMTSDGRFYGDLSIVDGNFMGRAQRMQLEWQKHVDVSRFSGGFMFEDMRLGASLPVSIKLRAYRDANAAREIPATRSRPVDFLTVRDRQSGDERSPDPAQRYEKDRDGVMFEVAYRPGRKKLLLTLAPMLEYVQPNIGARAIGDRIWQAVLQVSAAHVSRLPVDTPTSGHLVSLEHSAGKSLQAQASGYFQKSLLRLVQYFGVGPHASIAVAGTIGVGSENLPWHEQKSLGGIQNVRGYRYGELGRYKSYGVSRFELRVPLTKVEKSKDPEEESHTPKEDPESKTKSGPETKPGENAKSTPSTEPSVEKQGNLFSPKMLESLPALVGVVFGDVAASNNEKHEPIGASCGLGLRIGGVVSVEWTRTLDGQHSGVHFGLIDRSL